jgi:ABC-type transport system involved in multi-copper enzyme maturation permease subunit
MKAIIQKDLRENMKPALIGLAILSFILLQTYQASVTLLAALLPGDVAGGEGSLQPLLSPNLLSEAALFCAIFGAALGFLQSRNEANRDLWAFLIHRPVTRTEIFRGKVIAAVGLYVFGAGLPLLVFVAVVRWPGHVAAPFEWAMVLPLVSIFLSGLGFYFAGLLTGLRQARWYVSRAFGLGLAMIALMGIVYLTEFWQTLLLISVVVLLLATAAWGAYQTGGFYHGQAMAGSLASVVAVTAGCGFVLAAGAGLLGDLILQPLSDHTSVSSYYEMTREGAIYKLTFRNNELVAIEDLNGHPLLDPQTGQNMGRAEFNKHVASVWTAYSRFKYEVKPRSNPQNPMRFFSLISIRDKTFWYLDRHGELTGYDGRTRKYIGRLAPHGDNRPPASEPFLIQPNDIAYYNPYADSSWKMMATAKAVYRVDFRNRDIQSIFAVSNDDEIGAFTSPQGIYNESTPRRFFVTTRKTIYLGDSTGRTILSLPYLPGYSEYPEIQFGSIYATNNGPIMTESLNVWFHPDNQMNKLSGWKMPIHILWLGPDHTVTNRTDLPSIPAPDYHPWPDELATALAPPPAHLVYDNNISSPWNVLCIALAGVSAITGCLLARRYNFSTGAWVGWTLFIFVTGIAGLLGFLCAQDWPARERCPNCRKLRTVDREYCEHCAARFSPPAKTGTEIFEPLVKQA